MLDGAVEPVIPLEMGFLGASIPSWWYNSYETTGAASLAALADTGANFVGLTPTWYQDTLASDAIDPDANKTATDTGLVEMITGAHAENMLVMLKPHVDVWDGSWRGDITPTDTDAWFASYEDFIVYYAEIAQANGVELFVMGTELVALSGADYADEWAAVADAVYAVYGGTVTYAANHDEYQDVSFWDEVDYVGLDAYFDLGAASDASYDAILAAWDPFVTEVGDWMAAERGTQRAVFTEIGYRSIEGAHIRSWESWRLGTYDEQAQADCYRAALEAWPHAEIWPQADYLDAMVFWAWPVDLGTDVGGDLSTTGYSPYGKAAEDVLREYAARMYLDLPDLVTEITVSSRTPLPGETVTVEVTTRNIGPAAAAPADAADFRTVLFLRDAWSFDPVASSADIVDQEAYTDMLVGGERTFTVTFAAPLEPGRYYVGALTDADRNVFEGAEGNNLTAVDLWVNLAPEATAPIGDLDLLPGAPPTAINLPDRFNDPDIIGSLYRFISNMGTFDVHMFDAIAPQTVANFRFYADAGHYVDSIFHRSVPDFIIQSGGFAYTDAGGMVSVFKRPDFIVENEPSLNVRGTLAMAKLAGDPNSASNGWFINLADNADLNTQNGGFSPYGEVVGTGMDVADAIAGLPIWAFNEPFGDLPLIGYSSGQPVVQDHFVQFSSISQIAPLAFEVVTNTAPSLVTPGIDAAGVLTLTCSPGQTGTARITVRATDVCGATVDQTFDVDVGVAPTLDAWYSRRDHDGTELLLAIPDDASFSEPRTGGIETLVLQFSEAVNLSEAVVVFAGNGPDGPVDLSGIKATLSAAADRVLITFAPSLPDLARYLVRIDGVKDAAGNALVGDNDRVMTALAGDVDGDLDTDVFDLRWAWDYRGRLPGDGAWPTRCDVQADGDVDVFDMLATWGERGRDATGLAAPAVTAASTAGQEPEASGQTLAISGVPQEALNTGAPSVLSTPATVAPAPETEPLVLLGDVPALAALELAGSGVSSETPGATIWPGVFVSTDPPASGAELEPALETDLAAIPGEQLGAD